jgi:hypothetical protein
VGQLIIEFANRVVKKRGQIAKPELCLSRAKTFFLEGKAVIKKGKRNKQRLRLAQCLGESM